MCVYVCVYIYICTYDNWIVDVITGRWLWSWPPRGACGVVFVAAAVMLLLLLPRPPLWYLWCVEVAASTAPPTAAAAVADAVETQFSILRSMLSAMLFRNALNAVSMLF